MVLNYHRSQESSFQKDSNNVSSNCIGMGTTNWQLVAEKVGYAAVGALFAHGVQLASDLRKKENESNEKSHEYKAGVVAGKLAQKGITIARGQNPYVKNLKLSHALDQFIRPDKLGGLRFLYGPQGSGKSTHIREYVSEYVSKGGHGVVLSGTYSMEKLRFELSVPTEGELSSHVPKGTLIVIDQLENTTLGEDTDAFFRTLATESRNNDKFRVVACVSETDKSQRWLWLNGRDKIKELCPLDVLKWNENDIDEFIAKRFPLLSSDEKKFIRDLAIAASLPGFLVDVADTYGVTKIPLENPVVRNALIKRAKGYNGAWVKFKAVEDTLK